jgi:phosphinothricin acetyltransferase
MPQELKYRNAQLQDLPSIVAIYNSIVASRQVTADLEPVTVEQREGWFLEHRADTRPIWMIETGNRKTVGWISFGTFYGRPAYSKTAEISIYLHEDFRGKGIGFLALAHTIQTAPRLGIETLMGFIFEHNIPSINLFKKSGFQEWGNFPKIAELDGVKCTLTVMGKSLTPL